MNTTDKHLSLDNNDEDQCVYYTYTRNGVEYATPDVDLAFFRTDSTAYEVTYSISEVKAHVVQ